MKRTRVLVKDSKVRAAIYDTLKDWGVYPHLISVAAYQIKNGPNGSYEEVAKQFKIPLGLAKKLIRAGYALYVSDEEIYNEMSKQLNWKEEGDYKHA